MDFETIKNGIDFIAVLQQRGIELKKRGNRHVALCPFHSDSEPSFVVFPDGHFKCFGCGEYGDVFDFMQKYHGVDFKGALQALGIEQEMLTPEKREEIKKLEDRRETIKAFQMWEVAASNEAGMLCRACRKVLAEIKTEADLDRLGNLYHGLSVWQYHLDILIHGGNEAKLGLFRSGDYG